MVKNLGNVPLMPSASYFRLSPPVYALIECKENVHNIYCLDLKGLLKQYHHLNLKRVVWQ